MLSETASLFNDFGTFDIPQSVIAEHRRSSPGLTPTIGSINYLTR